MTTDIRAALDPVADAFEQRGAVRSFRMS